jgi:hypothetical protein
MYRVSALIFFRKGPILSQNSSALSVEESGEVCTYFEPDYNGRKLTGCQAYGTQSGTRTTFDFNIARHDPRGEAYRAVSLDEISLLHSLTRSE